MFWRWLDLDMSFSWRRVLVVVVVLCAGVFGLMPIDREIHLLCRGLDPFGRDLTQMLRSVGFYPTWVIIGIGFARHGWTKRRQIGKRLAVSRFFLLSNATATAGLLAEGYKLLCRRVRPSLADGEYVFRSWAIEPGDPGGIGMPSSHASVAFAGMFMLCMMLGFGRWMWLLLATACAATRVFDDAHFVSDVWVGALIGYCVARFLWCDHARRHRGYYDSLKGYDASAGSAV